MRTKRTPNTAMIAAALVGVLWGCKQREGDVCRCAADCQDGLVCAVGTTVLTPGMCGASGRTGTCIPNDDLPTDTTGTDPLPFPFDMGSKLDLGGSTGGTDSDSGSGDSGDSGDPGSGDSGDSGTDDAGSSDSGTDDAGSSDTGSDDSGTGDSGTDGSGTGGGSDDSGSGDSGSGGP